MVMDDVSAPACGSALRDRRRPGRLAAPGSELIALLRDPLAPPTVERASLSSRADAPVAFASAAARGGFAMSIGISIGLWGALYVMVRGLISVL